MQVKRLNRFFILLALYNPLKKIVKIIKMIEIQAIIPYSSAITGKIKSVCASGIYFFIFPSPGPVQYPPDLKAEIFQLIVRLF